MSRKQQKAEKDIKSHGVSLPVIHVGSSLRTYLRDLDATWVTQDSLSRDSHNKLNSDSRRYKNMLELSQHVKNVLPLQKTYWKMPGLSNNVLATNRGRNVTGLREKGLYEKRFRTWYGKLVHENTVILPPIKTSSRVKENIFDSSKLVEKRYITNHLLASGPVERFEHDELHVPGPGTYQSLTTCRECKRLYTRDVFIENFLHRNDKTYTCERKLGNVGPAGSPYCDVLGERFCVKCIEKRNKQFSQEIEDSHVTSGDIKNAHYKQPWLK